MAQRLALAACAISAGACGNGPPPGRPAAMAAAPCPYAIVVVDDGPPLALGTRVLTTSFASGPAAMRGDASVPRIAVAQAADDAAASAHGTFVAAVHTTLRTTGTLGIREQAPGHGQSLVGADDPVWVVTVKLPNPSGCGSTR